MASGQLNRQPWHHAPMSTAVHDVPKVSQRIAGFRPNFVFFGWLCA